MTNVIARISTWVGYACPTLAMAAQVNKQIGATHRVAPTIFFLRGLGEGADGPYPQTPIPHAPPFKS